MKDDLPFGRPSLVVDNDEPPTFKRSVAAARKRRQLTIHREWNDHSEWWVGHVFAGSEVYRIGGFTDLERALAASIAYFHEVVGRLDREARQAADRVEGDQP